MQQTVSAEAPSPTAAGFASLLSALIAPTPKTAPKSDAGWIDDDLADDFATLSYERAMRSHARYSASEFDDRSLTQAPGLESPPLHEELRDEESSFAQTRPPTASQTRTKLEPEVSRRKATAYERNLKNASITIRLSKAEYDQLHERAGEAGLTVSAYLRSCTFEAESLRAQVKETLAQLRTATSPNSHLAVSPEKQTVSSLANRSWPGWLGWLKRPLSLWNPSPRAVRA
jgi:predicted DNA binding CopG/RHH family protein